MEEGVRSSPAPLKESMVQGREEPNSPAPFPKREGGEFFWGFPEFSPFRLRGGDEFSHGFPEFSPPSRFGKGAGGWAFSAGRWNSLPRARRGVKIRHEVAGYTEPVPLPASLAALHFGIATSSARARSQTFRVKPVNRHRPIPSPAVAEPMACLKAFAKLPNDIVVQDPRLLQDRQNAGFVEVRAKLLFGREGFVPGLISPANGLSVSHERGGSSRL